jgi:hypothetical protein
MAQFNIHRSKMKQVEKKLATLNRRGSRIGGHLEITNVREYFEEREHPDARALGIEGRKVLVPMVSFEIEGTVPVVNGWTILARVEHTKEGNIISRIDDGEIGDWRTAAPVCDHCSTKRARRDTFFLRNESGEIRQIGRSCLADYVRSEDIGLATKFFFFTSFCNSLGSSPVDPSMYQPATIDFLSCACAAVRIDGGYRSKSFEGRSTASFSAWIYWPPSSMVPEAEKRAWADSQPTDDDKAKAEEILAWLATVDSSKSEYMHNLQIACANETVTERTQGIVASAVVSFDRSRAAEKTKKATKVSKYVGEIGKRIRGLQLVITKIFIFDTAYGTSCIVLMKDSEGNVFKWKSSKVIRPDEGDSVVVTGTVKEHAVYRDTKQTVLTRCAIQKAA